MKKMSTKEVFKVNCLIAKDWINGYLAIPDTDDNIKAIASFIQQLEDRHNIIHYADPEVGEQN